MTVDSDLSIPHAGHLMYIIFIICFSFIFSRFACLVTLKYLYEILCEQEPVKRSF